MQLTFRPSVTSHSKFQSPWTDRVDGSIVGKITLGSSSCSGSSFSGGEGGGGGVGGFLTTGFPALSSSTGGGGSGIISLALKSQNSSSYARHNMNIREIQTVSLVL